MATQTKPASGARDASTGLEQQGLRPSGEVHWNLVAPDLMLAAARRSEGEFAEMGPFVAVTAPHTGRSPNDKFVVREPATEGDVDWGKVNQPYSPSHFDVLLADVRAYLDSLDEADLDSLASLDDEPTAASDPSAEPPEASTMRRAKPTEELFAAPGSDLSIFGDAEDDEI